MCKMFYDWAAGAPFYHFLKHKCDETDLDLARNWSWLVVRVGELSEREWIQAPGPRGFQKGATSCCLNPNLSDPETHDI